MQALNDFLVLIDSFIGSASWFVYLLLGTGLFFTLYLRFPQIRYFGHALRVVRGKYDKKGAPGDTSHFQALTTALSGTVGTGNIAGVALAIHLGGPSALFWMLMTAFLGMTTKLVEVTLSMKYREKTADGTMSGGPMYFMKNKLNLPWLAGIFAFATILSSFGTGCLPQINSISNSLYSTFGINTIVTGAVLSVLLGLVIVGGIKRIAKFTERIVPFMAFIYVIGCLAVIFSNADQILPSIASIFGDVFSGTAAVGGFLGSSIAFAFNRGVNRGLFSNEAGQGSAPIAHASAKSEEPVSEGMVAILEPFIDTIVICTLTGLTLLASGAWNEKFENSFQSSDLWVLEGKYEQGTEVYESLASYANVNSNFSSYDGAYSGEITVENGQVISDVSLMHARSIAENVSILDASTEQPFQGILSVEGGKIRLDQEQNLSISGESLLHSAPLTVEAFKRGWFGNFGQYIVSIGLLLFAFSTAISWSYYGGRATIYLFGNKAELYFRIIYIIGFFLAAFTDTTIVWTLSGITIALMTVPNLICILFLRKDMRDSLLAYKKKMKI